MAASTPLALSAAFSATACSHGLNGSPTTFSEQSPAAVCR